MTDVPSISPQQTKKRGRPCRLDTHEFFLHLRLHPGEDDDLIAFFQSIPPRQRVNALKTALRAGGFSFQAEEHLDLESDLSASLVDMLL
jgi:hypothetical protein